MKNILWIITFWALQISASSAQNSISTVIADSHLAKVTVYPNGALLTRLAKVSLLPGKSEVIFKGISPFVNERSIQLNTKANVRILSVNRGANYLEEQAKQAEEEELEKRVEALRDQITHEKYLQEIYLNEEEMLKANQKIGGKNTGLKTIDLKEALEYQQSKFIELTNKRQESNKVIKKLVDELTKVKRQLSTIQTRKNSSTSNITITLSSIKAINTEFELSYFVDNAGWYPSYDLRVATPSDPILFSYKANIYQSSGEEWKNVKLTLSTAEPDKNATLPDLIPWRLPDPFVKPIAQSFNNNMKKSLTGKIFDENGAPLTGATIKIKGTSTVTVSDLIGSFKLEDIPLSSEVATISFIGYKEKEVRLNSDLSAIVMEPQNDKLEAVVVMGYGATKGIDLADVEVPKDSLAKQLTGKVCGVISNKKLKPSQLPEIQTKSYQTNFSFDVEQPYTISSDGKTYSVEMKQENIPATLEYRCIPKIETAAFLFAKIEHWENYNLMEGEINLYLEGNYVGKSWLNLQNSSDTLNISLGRDKSILIKRTKQTDFSRKQFMSSYRTDFRSWEISLRNTKPYPIKLIVEDQYPISTQKEIEIDRISHTGAALDPETGILKWDISLKAGEEQKLNFKYSVKRPSYRNLPLE